MNPDQAILAFLKLLADADFSFPPEAIKTLSHLDEKLAQLGQEKIATETEAKQALLNEIKAWCRQYPKIGMEVISRTREIPVPGLEDDDEEMSPEEIKLKPVTEADDEVILENRFPILPKLRQNIQLRQSYQANEKSS
ncbi:MAG: hypothetical protein SAJ37_05215 [Oscillatoria sp. PMC 1068.18]|nr:hypothetical protein [Oscillatoria sp. PMC 1076.18]MEC4988130.1 hypothetical protein [Oscillatoria sp. PMC 1068.18]